jgi:hypothetical protein
METTTQTEKPTEKTVRIERTIPTKGYECGDYPLKEALRILNTELESKRTIFIDGKHFAGEVIQEDDIKKCKNEISVTNQLIGG